MGGWLVREDELSLFLLAEVEVARVGRGFGCGVVLVFGSGIVGMVVRKGRAWMTFGFDYCLSLFGAFGLGLLSLLVVVYQSPFGWIDLDYITGCTAWL